MRILLKSILIVLVWTVAFAVHAELTSNMFLEFNL